MRSKAKPPKSGPQRKSRRLRIGTFADSYGDEYRPSKDDWAAMEAVYCIPFAEEDRAAITEIVQEYLAWPSFERNAPFQDDVVEILDNIQSGAKKVTDAFSSQSDDAKRRALIAVRAHIQCNFPGVPPGQAGMVVNALLQGLVQLSVACEVREGGLANDVVPGFEEGQAWSKMVRNLTAFAQERGRPTAASKGSGKSNSSKTSPFITFVRALQNTLPQDARRHTASDDALAAAISRARRKPRRAGQ